MAAMTGRAETEPKFRIVIDARVDVSTPSSLVGEITAGRLPGSFLPLEPQIFDQVQFLYAKAGREKNPELETLAQQAELASQILTLKASGSQENSRPVSDFLATLKEKYQVALHQVLEIALTPYREVITVDGKRFSRPACSIAELTGVFEELRGFGGLVTLLESGKLKFEMEDLKPLNQVFAGRQGKEILWSARTDGYFEMAAGMEEFQGILPPLPTGFRVVVWKGKLVDFERTLSNPLAVPAQKNLPTETRARNRALKLVDRWARKFFPIGKIWENDLGCDRGSGGFAVLATDEQGNSDRFLFGFCFENNNLVLGRAKLPCLEHLAEGIRDKFGPLPNLAGIEIKLGSQGALAEELKKFLLKKGKD